MTETKQILVDALRDAVLLGDAARIDELQTQLSAIRRDRVGNRAKQLRESIEQINARLAELKGESLAITEEKERRKKIYLQAYDAYRDALLAVQNCDVALAASDAETANLHDTKYQASTELKALSEKAAQKFESEGEGN